ncbi:MAG: methionyl-tRNA formyltransferase [Desulforudis sp.]|jgi:methionyl-tRNA formyltransferase|nr:MAG: methionyl-tRNA formyltransferase [Desulforudis sp.]
MRIVFMGTPEFAVVSLRAMLDADFPVTRVVTQPDRPRGRGRKLAASPVKEFAVRSGIEVWQPGRVRDPAFNDLLRELAPEVIVVVAFGQILSRTTLEIPVHGCINVHASLLPRYRGAAPIHRAIIDGEEITGVTTMYMDEGMDTGDMILRTPVPIERNDTVGTLHERLAVVGAELLVETLDQVRRGVAPRERQEHALATYAPMLTRDDEIIQWDRPAEDIRNHVRGMDPWPGACTRIGNETVKIWRVEVVPSELNGTRPGTVLSIDPEYGIIVQAGKDRVAISELQQAGGRRMPVDAFLRGRRLPPGTLFE